jgi:hypothetical protein
LLCTPKDPENEGSAQKKKGRLSWRHGAFRLVASQATAQQP